jgi:hypothetical protein
MRAIFCSAQPLEGHLSSGRVPFLKALAAPVRGSSGRSTVRRKCAGRRRSRKQAFETQRWGAVHCPG